MSKQPSKTDAQHSIDIRNAYQYFVQQCIAAGKDGLSVCVNPEYAGRFTKDSWSPYSLDSARVTITRTL